MSRHTLGIGSGHLVLGWDPPLQTFFFQLHDRAAEEPRIWLGCSWREIPTVDELLRAAAPYTAGTIWARDTASLRKVLEAEQAGDVA